MATARSEKKRVAPTLVSADKRARHHEHLADAQSTPPALCAEQTSTASERVLLEQVLIDLPLKDLFVLQRVNTSWRDVISRSEPIQKKMFLLPDGPVVFGEDDQEVEPVLPEIPSLRLNPILAMRCCDRSPTSTCEADLGCAHVERTVSSRPKFQVSIISLPQDASTGVENMLLTQPPLGHVIPWTSQKDGFGDHSLKSSSGLTLGDLMEVRRRCAAPAPKEPRRLGEGTTAKRLSHRPLIFDGVEVSLEWNFWIAKMAGGQGQQDVCEHGEKCACRLIRSLSSA